jgi:hypothetical protein
VDDFLSVAATNSSPEVTHGPSMKRHPDRRVVRSCASAPDRPPEFRLDAPRQRN